MILPVDWRTYRWGVSAGAGPASFQAGLNTGIAIWRVSANSAGGGTITFITLDDLLTSVVTLAAGGSMNVEPCGMYRQTIDFSAGITQFMVEFIRKKQ